MSTGEVMQYHEIALSVGPDDVDAVCNYIIENLSTGLLLEDEDGNSETVIKFYVAAEVEVTRQLDGLREYLDVINPQNKNSELRENLIRNIDWIEYYRKSVTPVYIGEGIVIIPPWDENEYPEKTKIIIDPRMAFGTGRHETSRSCLAEMENIDMVGKTVLDLGCGSGILSIYAALKGAERVLAYDIDPLAVDNSRDNFEINEVTQICRAEIGDIEAVGAINFDVTIVNIIREVIVPILGRLKEITRPGGIIVLSGLLTREREIIEQALRENGLNKYSPRLDNEWITFTVQVP